MLFPSLLTAVRSKAESMADEKEFKKYQAIMAAKRTRKTEKNKSGKGKDRLLPEKLTIHHYQRRLKDHPKNIQEWGL